MEYKIGDNAEGGIVFFVDESGEHGFVAAKRDQSSGTNGINWYDAKKICSELELNGFTDWFLPSRDQLKLMYDNLHKADLGDFVSGYYWSSWEYDKSRAVYQGFNYGDQYDYSKGGYAHVRAVRAF